MAQKRNSKNNAVIGKVKKLIAAIRKDGTPVESAYLFGSWAEMKERAGSDIDVCIVSSDFRDEWEAMRYLWKKAMKIDTAIEPVAYHPKYFKDTSPLVWEIKQTGLQIV